jgi:hypothetical protein
MAQDPERDDEQELAASAVDTSHDLDMEPLYFSQTIEAEPEAEVIRGLLEANGIPTTLSSSPVPTLGFEIQVPKNRIEEALRLIAESQVGGPEAAAEAEAAGESEPRS